MENCTSSLGQSNYKMEKRLKLEPTPPPPPKNDNYQVKNKHTNFISGSSCGESANVRAAASEDPHSCAFICTPSSPFGRTCTAALFPPLLKPRAILAVHSEKLVKDLAISIRQRITVCTCWEGRGILE